MSENACKIATGRAEARCSTFSFHLYLSILSFLSFTKFLYFLIFCPRAEKFFKEFKMEHKNLQLLVGGARAFPEILGCIENAKTSLQINMFIWRDDEIGNRMARAVVEAADRGVQVDISADRYGVVLEKCEEAKKSFFHKKMTFREKLTVFFLKRLYPGTCGRGGAADRESPLYRRMMEHPNIRVSADVFKADHSKYYIIDDEILFLGGVNIEDKENGADRQGRVYGDYMARLTGREYVQAFRTKLETGENLREDLFFGLNRKVPRRRFEMEELYLDLINGAEKTLHITMAYFSPLEQFLDAILAAHRRGVQVTILVPEQANFQNDSNRRTLKKLLQATGGEIGVYLSPKMLHTKLVMSDRLISFGSTNITRKAFAQLDELNLFLPSVDSQFRRDLLQSIASDLAESRRVHRGEQIRYNRLLAFLEGFVV